MPRYRTVKPEFWTSEQVIECSTNARLMFIGLWNFCDDSGRHPFRPKQIKVEVFPGDDFSTADIERMLDELSTNGLIRTYEVEGQRYLEVTGWHHQKIDRPQKPKYPAPIVDGSTNNRRPLDPEYKRIEGNRIEIGAVAPNDAYAYVGKVVKLKPDEFKSWQEANPHIELRSYLIARDAWLAEQPQAERKRWYISTSADLRNKNLQAKRAGKGHGPPQSEKAGCLTIKDL